MAHKWERAAARAVYRITPESVLRVGMGAAVDCGPAVALGGAGKGRWGAMGGTVGSIGVGAGLSSLSPARATITITARASTRNARKAQTRPETRGRGAPSNASNITPHL